MQQKIKKIVVFVVFILFLTPNAFALFELVSQIEDAKIKQVAVSQLDPKLVYVASDNSLFKSQDYGETFQKTHSFKDEEVVRIFFDLYLADVFYLAGQRHFYQISDEKVRLFSAPDESQILSAAKFKGNIYVGTTSGLYCADSTLLNWKQLPNLSTDSKIYYIAAAKDRLLISTERGIYLLDAENRTERVFVARETEADEAKVGLVVNFIKQDIFNPNLIWLGTSRGLFSSVNVKTWDKVYLAGLDNLSVNCLAQTALEKNTFYLGTDQGFFKVNIQKKQVTPIFEGIHASVISWAEFDAQGQIYLATSKGLFKSNYFTTSSSLDSWGEMPGNEPSINEIQQASLQYNEVHPDKIRKWRTALKYRALAPSLNLDYDKTISYDSGADRYFIGPRDWGVGLSWDLGNFIWSNYEDDIDTRSRLNTQLRLDILDELNRVYFERLRLKREFEDSALSQEELFKRKLRLNELTAILDGYTGGYFSQRIKELNGR